MAARPRKPCAQCGGVKLPGKGQAFCGPCKERPRYCKKCGSEQKASIYKGRPNYSCRKCVVQRATARRDADPEAVRIARLVNRYGVTEEFIRALEAKSAGKCPLCGAVPQGERRHSSTILNLDHDHETGKPRAFICSPCNRAIGLVQERPLVLIRMAAYLTQHAPSLAAMVLPEDEEWTTLTPSTPISSALTTYSPGSRMAS